MIEDRRRGNDAVIDISFPEIEKFDRLPEPSVEGPTAFVSIMEGCSKYCTFCVVPYTRGEEVSGPLMMSLRKWPVWRVAGLEKSICWAKM
jgi:tRNA-2-methylthio-N6-dimethylallyladenosine synthase